MQTAKASAGSCKSKLPALQPLENGAEQAGKKKSWAVRYHEWLGYHFIPQKRWEHGLAKRKNAPFSIASFSKFLIVPNSGVYPHMSMSVAGALFFDKDYVGIRPASMHYSPSDEGERCTFYPFDRTHFRAERELPKLILDRARGWLQHAQLPYILLNYDEAIEAPSDDEEEVCEQNDVQEEAKELPELEKETPKTKAEIRRKSKGRKGKKPKSKKKGRSGKSGARSLPALPSKVAPACTWANLLFMKDYTEEWNKALGVPNFVEALEECELGAKDQYDAVKTLKAFNQAMDEYSELAKRVLEERKNTEYLLITAFDNYGKDYKRLAHSIRDGGRNTERIRELLRRCLATMKGSASLFVSYGESVVNRQQFCLPFMNPKDLPSTHKYQPIESLKNLKNAVDRLAESLSGFDRFMLQFQEASECLTKASSDTEAVGDLEQSQSLMELFTPKDCPTGKESEIESSARRYPESTEPRPVAKTESERHSQICLMNLRIVSALLNNLQVAAYTREMEAFVCSAQGALLQVADKHNAQIIRGVILSLQHIELNLLRKFSSDEGQARESIDGWYRFCGNLQEYEESYRRLNGLFVELLGLSCDLTELLIEADQGLKEVVSRALSHIPAELSDKLVAIGEGAAKNEGILREAVSQLIHKSKRKSAIQIGREVNLHGLDTLDKSDELMDIMRNLHVAVRQHVHPSEPPESGNHI